MEDNERETKQNTLMRKLAGHLAQIYSKHIDAYNPTLTKQKAKLVKIKPSQSLEPFERCEYKIVDRPPIQLFKQQEEEMTKSVKILKKSNKSSSSLKKRTLKTNKVSNLYFDPEGDSIKRYRELYTYKNPPGIRTVTMIQEAVNIYNDILQKARAKKNYLGRRKKRREEFLDSFSLRKHPSDDGNMAVQRKSMKPIPSKDFLERNKLRKTKREKAFEQCDILSKTISLSKLPLLPTQEFLNRNKPKKSNDDVDFSNDEYLLRIKTPCSSKKLLPVPVVKIGFQDESMIDLQTKKVHMKESYSSSYPSNKYICRDPLLQCKVNKTEKEKMIQKSLSSGNEKLLPITHSDSYRENLVDYSYDCREDNLMGSSVSVINVGFQYDSIFFPSFKNENQINNIMPTVPSTKKTVKKREEKMDLFLNGKTFKDIKKESASLDSLLDKQNLNATHERSLSLKKIDNQWMRMQKSIENLKKTKYISAYMSNHLKDKFRDTQRKTLPDKMTLLLNKEL